MIKFLSKGQMSNEFCVRPAPGERPVAAKIAGWKLYTTFLDPVKQAVFYEHFAKEWNSFSKGFVNDNYTDGQIGEMVVDTLFNDARYSANACFLFLLLLGWEVPTSGVNALSQTGSMYPVFLRRSLYY